MKQYGALLLLVLLCALLAAAGRAERASFCREPLPESLLAPCGERGEVVRIDYDTYVYDKRGERGERVRGEAFVYLPYGYDPARRYDVLYLMHGLGENAGFWLGQNEYAEDGARGSLGAWRAPRLLDRMIAEGRCPPMIVVSAGLAAQGRSAPRTFRYEFLYDLIPAVEGRFSTCAQGDASKESLEASRAHRAFAGNSQGSAVGWASMLTGCLDEVGYIGCFSGCYADAYAAARAVSGAKHAPLYWYNGSGSADGSRKEHLRAYRQMLKSCPDRLWESGPEENCCFVEKPGMRHDFESWLTDLYNALLVFFRV